MAARPGGVRRRLRGHLQPRGAARATASRPPAPARTRFTLLHDTERDAFPPRSTRSGTGTTLLVDTYDVAEAVRLGVEVAGPELGAVRLDSGDLGVLAHAGPRAARRARRHRHPDRRDQRPRRVRDRRARRRAGRRLRRRHLAGHRQRPPDLRLRLQAGRPRGRRRRDGRRWPRRARTRSRSAAASARCAGATAAGVAEAEVVGIGSPPVDDGDDRDAAGAAGARRRGRRPRAARRRPRAARRRPRRAAARGPPDVAGRAGDPDGLRAV